MTVDLKGDEELHLKLRTLAELKAAIRGLQAGALHIKGKIDDYAPATAANSPGNPSGRWYQRGYGPRWRRKSGGIGGRKTSETLGRKWTTEARDSGFTQVIGNNVSYGPCVQSAEKQASFHAARGWKTDKEVLAEEKKKVLDFISSEIRKDINK